MREERETAGTGWGDRNHQLAQVGLPVLEILEVVPLEVAVRGVNKVADDRRRLGEGDDRGHDPPPVVCHQILIHFRFHPLDLFRTPQRGFHPEQGFRRKLQIQILRETVNLLHHIRRGQRLSLLPLEVALLGNGPVGMDE